MSCEFFSFIGRLFGTLTIACDLVTAGGTLYWRKSGNRYVINRIENKYTGTNSQNLKILNLQYNDDGHYRCELYSVNKQYFFGNYTTITVHGKWN